MSLNKTTLGALFQMSRDAVLGIENERILFLNPAASALLGAAEGDDASRYLPDYILSDPAEQFIASIRLKDRQGHVSLAREGSFALVSITLPPEETPTPSVSRMMREFSGTLLSARLAIDMVVNKTGAEDNPNLKNYTAILYKDYFIMKRMCEHITLADALEHNTLPFRPQAVFVDRLCRELCDTAAHFTPAMDLTLEFATDADNCCIMGDPALLETMLLNLLTNSFSHSAPGSKVRMSLTCRNNRMILSVDDRGSGIAPENMAPVLDGSAEPGTTDTTAGAGLGLGIARGIAEIHGGALILESRPGLGTKMRISIPLPASGSDILHNLRPSYRSDGMDRILTELSVILDKKFYNKTMFD